MNRLFKLLLFFGFLRGAAQLPETNVWLFPVSKNKSGAYLIGEPSSVSHNKGYNNQPSFSSDGKLLYYSGQNGTQTDIFVFDIKKKRSMPITSTGTSEYTPRVYPGGHLLSAVVVEKDSAQRLHVLNLPAGTFSKKLDTDSIGYYTFLNTDTLVFYKLTDPHSLRWRTVTNGTENVLARNPVRTFWAVNRHSIIFGVTDSNRVDYLLYDFSLMKGKRFATHSPGSEDIWWHDELGLLIASGKSILRYDPANAAWNTLFDLGRFGITRITRFVFDPSGKFLAITDNPKSP